MSIFIPILAFALVAVGYYFVNQLILKNYPPVAADQVVFREDNASGYAHDSFITRAGEARGVLSVIVTHDELRFQTPWFFAWAAAIYQQLHRIPLSDIASVEAESDRKTTIKYRIGGGYKRFSVKLRRSQSFRAALQEYAGV
jgi:hypothetical protein